MRRRRYLRGGKGWLLAPAVVVLSLAVCVSASAAPVPANVVRPQVSGTPRDGETLTASPGVWVGIDVTTTYRYRWQRCTAESQGCADIPSATGESYTLTASDVDHSIRVVVRATSLVAESDDAPSNPTDRVSANPPANVEPPSIRGPASAGQLLAGDPGRWGGSQPPATKYAFHWQRCKPSARCADIAAADQDAYRVTNDDVDHRLRVVVVASNSAGSARAESGTTAPVQPADLRPIANVRQLVRPTAGKVRVRPRGATDFVAIESLTAIPDRSEVDTISGEAELIVATEPDSDATSSLETSQGEYIVDQAAGAHPITELRLSRDLSECKLVRAGNRRGSLSKSWFSRRLFTRGRGRFRTRGRVASGAVRGTTWLTEDVCSGTRIKTQKGVVQVYDFKKRKTIFLPAPLSYFARR